MRKIIQAVLHLGAIGVSVFLLFFVICCVWIGYDVKQQCQTASRTYGGDCVTALSTLLSDEHRGFRERNNAIWALGQLGDSRAYPLLSNMYTGNIPDREPLDTMISQYELKKAVALTNGGFNMTAVFWRYGIQ
ncbi:MAG: HEAT repeat domain-containing protein [Microgenomates group bacterium]